jgi:hypothetical protein
LSVEPAAGRSPAPVLAAIADELRGEGTVISEHVVEPNAPAALGALVAAGPRCASAPGEYARVIESVREGYLLHYGAPRIVAGVDRDLALLAGDHLYALGLERLALLGDLEAIRELADLISLCAQVHARPRADVEAAQALWLAASVAIAAGPADGHAAAKTALRSGSHVAADALRRIAEARASEAGLAAALSDGVEAIESGADHPPAGA